MLSSTLGVYKYYSFISKADCNGFVFWCTYKSQAFTVGQPPQRMTNRRKKEGKGRRKREKR